LLRGHSPDRDPAWFGPAIGSVGANRFDLRMRTVASDPGVCYLAPALEGVLLERVIRDVRRSVLSLDTLRMQHAVTHVVTTRELLLVDLLVAPWVRHGVQLSEITAPPPYEATQSLAERLLGIVPGDGADAPPSVPDGIAYGSRFGAAIECLALWDRAADALRWDQTTSITADLDALAAACLRVGVGLVR
jgi:RES domain